MLRVCLAMTVCLAIGACATGSCDYGTYIGSCEASIEPEGHALMVVAPRCSTVDYLAEDGQTHSVRIVDKARRIGSNSNAAEIKVCRLYKETSATPPH
jgi:hypothetical protein